MESYIVEGQRAYLEGDGSPISSDIETKSEPENSESLIKPSQSIHRKSDHLNSLHRYCTSHSDIIARLDGPRDISRGTNTALYVSKQHPVFFYVEHEECVPTAFGNAMPALNGKE